MIRYKSEYTFGDTVYIKTDPEQSPYQLTGVRLAPSYKAEDPAVPIFIISHAGENIEVYDFEVSKSIAL